MLKKNSNKVLAYELDYDIYWEPGLPPKDDPGYWAASEKTERYESRQIGLDNDVWLDEGALPNNTNISFCLPSPPGYNVHYLLATNVYGTLPTPILFVGLIGYLDDLDYPCNDRRWPIVSLDMLRVLESVGDFKHRTYPIIINDSSNDKPPGVNKNFVILQTLEYLDAFDFDKSEYVMNVELDGCIKEASKVILKEPDKGFPPIFRLNAESFFLFVSATAKEALEKAGKDGGIEFTPVDDNFTLP
jgi:hypothetical protein